MYCLENLVLSVIFRVTNFSITLLWLLNNSQYHCVLNKFHLMCIPYLFYSWRLSTQSSASGNAGYFFVWVNNWKLEYSTQLNQNTALFSNTFFFKFLNYSLIQFQRLLTVPVRHDKLADWLQLFLLIIIMPFRVEIIILMYLQYEQN